jgi:hypothetical protein
MAIVLTTISILPVPPTLLQCKNSSTLVRSSWTTKRQASSLTEKLQQRIGLIITAPSTHGATATKIRRLLRRERGLASALIHYWIWHSGLTLVARFEDLPKSKASLEITLAWPGVADWRDATRA